MLTNLKPLIYFAPICVIIGCNNEDDSRILNSNSEQTVNVIYIFSNNYSIVDQKYYSGSDGKEHSLKADTFFKNQWSFYENPSIKTIQLKKDSIVINENLAIQKFKYIKEENNIFIIENNKKIVFGNLDTTKQILSIYKNYQSSLIISNKETNETFYKKSSNYGKVNYNDIFPLLISSPTALTIKDEYVFWSNIEYVFKK